LLALMGDGGVASVGRMSTRACSDARRGTDRPPQLNHMPTTIITDTDKEVTVLTSTDVGRQTASRDKRPTIALFS